MKNKYNYPSVIVKAIENSAKEYDAGTSFITASSITTPPRIFWLSKRYAEEIKEGVDVSDRVASLLGTSVHYMIEKAAEGDKDSISEMRFHGKIGGEKVSAQIDHYSRSTKTLSDFKVTSIAALTKGAKKEWEYQLNMQRFLLPYEVEKLQIVGIAKDWSSGKARHDKDYPPTPIVVVDIPLWAEGTYEPLEECVKRLKENEHVADEDLPSCTDEEKWKGETVYALYKKGSKRATKLFSSQIAALAAQSSIPNSTIQEREGESRRCKICAVRKWCNDYTE